MAYPDDLLVDGERVALYTHPHWRICLGPAVAFLLAVAVGAFLAAVIRRQPWAPIGWLVLGVVVVALVVRATVVPFARWRSTHMVVTNHRLLVREGVFARSGIDVPIGRVESVRTRRTLTERLAGCGTLIVDAGGEEPMSLRDVPAVERAQAVLHREISREIDRRRAEREAEPGRQAVPHRTTGPQQSTGPHRSTGSRRPHLTRRRTAS